MKILAVIPAKGQSTRLYKKNLKKIGDKTLIEIAVNCAKASKNITEIVVSTDSEEIKQFVESKNLCKCILRGPELSGETPLFEVYKHVYNYFSTNTEITHIVGLQPDNPDRNVDLDFAIKYVLDNKLDDLFTVNKNGQKNGSLRILSAHALQQPPLNVSTINDECTNIHTIEDLNRARYSFTKKDFIEVSGKRIGNNEDVFVVAEAACNHMCDLDLAKRMIDNAAEAGADAIKFQTYKAERLVTSLANAYWGNEKSTQLEYYKNLDKFDQREYQQLFDYAKQRGMVAFSTPFDIESANMLNEIGMELYKIPSCEINNIALLKHVAKFNKPIILSTGAATVVEIDNAVNAIFGEQNYNLVLLACTLSYPTDNENANLNRISTLLKLYPDITIGLSDHTRPDKHMVIPALAVAMGARVIEKHYTLDREWTGSGHFFSIQPDDLKEMVHNIKLAKTVLGTDRLGITTSEQRAVIGARKSIVASMDIKKGTRLTKDMLTFKRPGTGLPPEKLNELIGRIMRQDIAYDTPLDKDMVED